jgi:hypothetical protein
VRLLVVLVRRNELNQQRVDIPPHELPVLGYVHGEEACRVVGELLVDRDMLSPGEEYSRLAQKYGRDKANESMEPRVAAVYGASIRGEQALADAMEWGQREDLTLAAFQFGSQEPSHTAPKGLNPLRSTQVRPNSHTGPRRDKKGARRKAPQLVTPGEGARAPGVAQLPAAQRPAAMQPGDASAKRAQTTKQKRAASGMAGGSK